MSARMVITIRCDRCGLEIGGECHLPTAGSPNAIARNIRQRATANGTLISTPGEFIEPTDLCATCARPDDQPSLFGDTE